MIPIRNRTPNQPVEIFQEAGKTMIKKVLNITKQLKYMVY